MTSKIWKLGVAGIASAIAALGALAGSAMANTAGGIAMPLSQMNAASESAYVQLVHFRNWRHCHWRHGNRWCHGRHYESYGPGVNLYLDFGGNRFRHNHHHRHFGHHQQPRHHWR